MRHTTLTTSLTRRRRKRRGRRTANRISRPFVLFDDKSSLIYIELQEMCIFPSMPIDDARDGQVKSFFDLT